MPPKTKKKSSQREKMIKWVPKKDKLPGSDLRQPKKWLKRAEKDLPAKTVVVSRPSVSPQDLLKEITEQLKAGNTDPVIREMAKYAVGDVVGLGLMSQEQFDEQEEYDEDGNMIRRSGRMKALEMIPAVVRSKLLCEIAPYFLAKKGTNSGVMGGPKPRVSFYIPENGRPVRTQS